MVIKTWQQVMFWPAGLGVDTFGAGSGGLNGTDSALLIKQTKFFILKLLHMELTICVSKHCLILFTSEEVEMFMKD